MRNEPPVCARVLPEWLAGLSHADFLFNGTKCDPEQWAKLDWSRARLDMGPSPMGNPGPYWHVPWDYEGEELWARLYPKLLRTKWLPLIRHAILVAAAPAPKLAARAVTERYRIEPWMANRIWHVLVEECGARHEDWRDHHYSFIHYLGTEAGGFGHEYRFMGKLGFGGKFYNEGFRWRVGCYPEHDTPERTAMIAAANARLAELFAIYHEPATKSAAE